MRPATRSSYLTVVLLVLAARGVSAQSATVLYRQDFEHPNGFSLTGRDLSQQTVNDLYSNQPPGFTFSQSWTVETLLVGGTQAFGVGYKDPQARAGRYVTGMLSSVQDDLLGLAFNVGSFKFLNFRLDISSIDLDGTGGPFVPAGGVAPVFRFSLFDNPGGAPGLGGGAPLSVADATGTVAPNKYTFDWSNVVAALDATGTTNGNVILRIDLLAGEYAAMDNFVVAASDTPGDVPGAIAPEPESWVLVLSGCGILSFVTRSRSRPNEAPD